MPHVSLNAKGGEGGGNTIFVKRFAKTAGKLSPSKRPLNSNQAVVVVVVVGFTKCDHA